MRMAEEGRALCQDGMALLNNPGKEGRERMEEQGATSELRTTINFSISKRKEGKRKKKPKNTGPGSISSWPF